MMSFLEWVQVHNNWFPALSFYVLCSIWAFILSYKGTWKHVVVSFVMFVILGATTINYFLLYEDGYKEYTKNWESCTTQKALDEMYVFDNVKEKCMKPVVGFVPTESVDVLEIKNGDWT
ncbi:hypothetical protein Av05_00111 [Escherichia phage Av-05]|uniref:Putative membrane protein n=1 Tax=Escherichia phage Av-05 TaxID=1527519 RepID=A0A076GCM8_9CAUD|nr:hypothetical protein Av05_00111 [Escherichia phage Av-05]AII27654.1 putative membrane protein [Escherichia phage Av-05]